MTKASDIVKLAKKQVGKGYKKYCKAYGVNTDWCVIFIWWLFHKEKASKLFCNGTKQAVVGNVARWGKNAKLDVPLKKAKAGDIVIFDWKNSGYAYDHIGIFIEKNKDGSYKTIEGNTLSSNFKKSKVAYRNRYASDICMVIRPKYEVSKAPSKKFNLTRKLKQGCKGSDVKELQKKLGVTADGIFGPATEKALVKYQKSKGWKPSGVVRTKTAHSFGWLYKNK